jgi:LytS/YehU family sensor histidine kinase
VLKLVEEVYVDRRDNWIKEEVEGASKLMDADITRYTMTGLRLAHTRITERFGQTFAEIEPAWLP